MILLLVSQKQIVKVKLASVREDGNCDVLNDDFQKSSKRETKRRPLDVSCSIYIGEVVIFFQRIKYLRKRLFLWLLLIQIFPSGDDLWPNDICWGSEAYLYEGATWLGYIKYEFWNDLMKIMA